MKVDLQGVDQIIDDSRQAKPGAIFFAIAQDADARAKHVEEALAKGVSQVFVEQSDVSYADPRVQAVTDVRKLLGKTASAFYGHPSQQLHVVGVTGTNGKTSVCHLLAQAWHYLGQKAAILGTAGNGIWPALTASEFTTLSTVTLHCTLAEFVKAGVTHVAMEVSSHGLAQERIAGVYFAETIFTNLTQDHLDYHHTMTEYAAEKRKLFDYPQQFSLINIDEAVGRSWLASMTAKQIKTYSLHDNQANFYLHVSGNQLPRDVFVQCGQYHFEFKTQLIGDFNAYNLLAVIAILILGGFKSKELQIILPKLMPPPGRLQWVRSPGKPICVIDYAHTPDALNKALLALQPYCKGQLICVLGCGGDRDRDKRPKMARVAEETANYLVLTNDNPRTEPPEQIIEDMRAGLARPDEAIICLDREAAIRHAFSVAKKDDMILIAGKGHEDYQIVGTEKRPFSDLAIAKKLCEET